MRTCRVCLRDLPASGFYGRSTECKVCCSDRKRAEYAADPEKFKARTLAYQAANPLAVQATRAKANGTEAARDRARRGYLRKHGITEEQYDDLFLAQESRCAICLSDQPGRYWCIDHDHSCCDGPYSCGGCVRGILCWHCNVALGHFRDSPDSLRNAVAYLSGGRHGA